MFYIARVFCALNKDDAITMDIRDEDITKYQSIIKSRLGKEIDRAKALEELTKLCMFMAVITRPVPQEKDFKKLNKKEK